MNTGKGHIEVLEALYCARCGVGAKAAILCRHALEIINAHKGITDIISCLAELRQKHHHYHGCRPKNCEADLMSKRLRRFIVVAGALITEDGEPGNVHQGLGQIGTSTFNALAPSRIADRQLTIPFTIGFQIRDLRSH